MAKLRSNIERLGDWDHSQVFRVTIEPWGIKRGDGEDVVIAKVEFNLEDMSVNVELEEP